MSTVIGAMEAYLKLNIKDFETNLEAARKQVESISTGFDAVTAVGNKLTGVGTKLTLGLTTPIIGFGTACTKTTADFDSTMSKVSAISGATGKDLDALRDKAKEMGAKTKFSASEAGDAFTYMAMAGWDTNQMLDGISGIMSLAAADGLDLATTSDIVTDALTAFGMEAKDSGHFADVLAKASSSANTNVSMLGESFKYVAPVAGALGYSAEDTAVALGLMANAGIKGSQGGTALRAALSRMIKPTKDSAAIMKQYGLSLTNTDGSMKSLGEVMTMLRDNMGDLSQAEQAQAAATLFGQEAMSGMLSIINASDTDFNKLTDAIYNADGTAQNMADTMNNNLNGQLVLLKSGLESLAISFGELIVPVVRKVVSGIQNLVEKLNSMDEKTRKAVITAALVVASIGPVLAIVGKTISTVGKLGSAISNIKAFVTAASSSLSGMGVSLSTIAGPVLAVVAVIAVLVAAFKHLWDTNEEFREAITSIWEGIVSKIQEFCQGIVDRLNSLGFEFSNITEVIKAVWDGFCNFLAPVFEGVFQYISDFLSTTLDVIMGVVDVFISIFKGDWEGAWNAVKGIFESIWNGLVSWFTNILNVIKGVANVVLGWFGTTWETVWGNIKSFFEGIWNSIVSFFNGIATGLKNIVTSIKDFFTNTWTAIKTAVTTTVTNLVTGIQTKFNAFKTSISGILTNIKEFFSNIWTAIKNVVGGIVLVLIDLITGDFKQLKTDISTVTTNIKTALTNAWNSIKTAITTVVTAIKNFVTNTWTSIKTSVSNTITSMKTSITNTFNSIKTSLSNTWTSIKTSITNTVNSIKTSISNVFNGIKTFLSTAVTTMKTSMINGFNAMKTGVSTTVSNIKTAIVNGINNAVSFIKALPSQALTWGSHMVQGFANGVKNAMSSLINSVKGLADKVRSLLHFTRPDEGPLRDYETWMPDMVQGLAKTLDSAAPGLIDRVKALSGNMADALTGGTYQVALAGAGGDIRAGGTAFAERNYSALGSPSEKVVEKTEININKIEVRDDNDLDMVTQGLYNKQDQNLRALGRRTL